MTATQNEVFSSSLTLLAKYGQDKPVCVLSNSTFLIRLQRKKVEKWGFEIFPKKVHYKTYINVHF